MRGSSFGRLSLPIHVNSNFCFLFAIAVLFHRRVWLLRVLVLPAARYCAGGEHLGGFLNSAFLQAGKVNRAMLRERLSISNDGKRLRRAFRVGNSHDASGAELEHIGVMLPRGLRLNFVSVVDGKLVLILGRGPECLCRRSSVLDEVGMNLAVEQGSLL